MTECSEGVYLASGGQTGEDPAAGGCDSRYMRGGWKKPDYSNSNVQMRAYDRKGCEGCAADDGDGCKRQKRRREDRGKCLSACLGTAGTAPGYYGLVEKMPVCRSGRKFMLDSINTEFYT